MRRFFTNESLPMTGEISLGGDEAKHMLTVLRMQKGDKLILINGSGKEALSEIVETSGEAVRLNILEISDCGAEPTLLVTLVQGLPKAGKLDLIVQKCVELGIWRVQPAAMARSVVKLDKKDNKTERLNRISHEAAKQCGRAGAPEVCAPIKLEECAFDEFDAVIVAYEDEHKLTLKSVLVELKQRLKKNARIALVIGPEGGFEAKEIEFILSRSKNAYAVTLGSRILRTETAGMAMLAMLMYEMED